MYISKVKPFFTNDFLSYQHLKKSQFVKLKILLEETTYQGDFSLEIFNCKDLNWLQTLLSTKSGFIRKRHLSKKLQFIVESNLLKHRKSDKSEFSHPIFITIEELKHENFKKI